MSRCGGAKKHEMNAITQTVNAPLECPVTPRGLESVQLTDSDSVRDELETMR